MPGVADQQLQSARTYDHTDLKVTPAGRITLQVESCLNAAALLKGAGVSREEQKKQDSHEGAWMYN